MAEKYKKGFKQALIRPLLWSILAGVAIYGGFVIFSDLNTVGESIAKLGLIGWMTVLGLSLVNYGLRFVRWELYLRRLHGRIPVLSSLAYYFSGFAFTTTPGKAGEAVRSIYLKRHGVTYVHSLAAFFTERFVDLVAMVLLALVAVLTFPDYQWPILIVALLVVTILPIIHAKPFHVFLNSQLDRLPPEKKLRSVGSHFLDLLGAASMLTRSGPLYVGIVLALVAWGAEGVAFHVILKALDIETSLGLAVGIYCVSVLAGAVSLIPGGLGSTEAVMVLLLKLVGADAPAAVAATLICRLATLWFAVAIGTVFFSVLEANSEVAHAQVPRV
jgi:uncharacterized protein (TIRG00374 family)